MTRYHVLFAFLLTALSQKSSATWDKYSLNNSTQYLEADCPVEVGSTYRRTPSTRFQKPIKQRVLLHEETPSVRTNTERVLLRAIPGQDGRMRITDTTQWPYLTHGALSLVFNSLVDGNLVTNVYRGSANLIGPHHIFTAGHNVYDSVEGWAQNVSLYLGLNDGSAPFSVVQGVNIFVHPRWISEQNPEYDMAIITLNHSIGMENGWLGVMYEDDSSLHQRQISIGGYPTDKSVHADQFWTMTHLIKSHTPEELFYEIDTHNGQSGAAIIITDNKNNITDNDNLYLVGVHANGEEPLDPLQRGNHGPRISQQKFADIVEILRSTWEIAQRLPRRIFTTFIPTELGGIRLSASYNGTNWVEEYQPYGALITQNSPSLIRFGNELYMFYTAANGFPYPLNILGDRIVYSTSTNGMDWSEARVTNDKWPTQHPVSLAVFKNRLYMSHISVGLELLGGHHVFVGYSKNGRDWPLNQCCDPHNWSSNLPASFAVYKDRLFLSHVHNNSIFMASTEDGVSWSEGQNVNDGWKTRKAVGLVPFKEKLFMAHLGMEGIYEGRIFLSSSNDGHTWNHAYYANQGWRSAHTPCWTVFNNRLFLTHVGLDNMIYCAHSDDGQTWSRASVLRTNWKTDLPISIYSSDQ